MCFGGPNSFQKTEEIPFALWKEGGVSSALDGY